MIIDGKRYKGLQAYKEKGKDTFLYVHRDSSFISRSGLMFECYAGLMETTRLPNCISSCSADWLNGNCREMSYRKLPEDVKNHLKWYVS